MREELGYYECDFCKGKFQVLNESGDDVDWSASVQQVRDHQPTCTAEQPNYTDPNATY